MKLTTKILSVKELALRVFTLTFWVWQVDLKTSIQFTTLSPLHLKQAIVNIVEQVLRTMRHPGILHPKWSAFQHTQQTTLNCLRPTAACTQFLDLNLSTETLQPLVCSSKKPQKAKFTFIQELIVLMLQVSFKIMTVWQLEHQLKFQSVTVQ